MKSIVLSILIILPALSFSQGAPGYLGKKMVAGYEMRTFPSFANPNSEITDPSEDISTSLNAQHRLFFERVIGTRSSLGIDVGYISTFYLSSNSFAKNITAEEVSALSFDISYKYYSFHSAPFGLYSKFSLGMVQVNPSDYFKEGASLFSKDLFISGQSRNMLNIGVGYGVNRVIADKLLLGLGFDINLSFPGLAQKTSDDERYFDEDSGDSELNQEILSDRAMGRIAIQNLLNFKITIGYLF